MIAIASTWLWVHWVDLIGWFGTNVVVGMFAPLLGMCAMRQLNQMTANLQYPFAFTVDYFAPYREAQLGYMVLGWAMAAVFELAKMGDLSIGWRMGGIIVLFVIAASGGVLAAIGASNHAFQTLGLFERGDADTLVLGARSNEVNNGK